MAKRKLPTAREYIKTKFAPAAGTSPEDASVLFHATINANVKGNPKPTPNLKNLPKKVRDIIKKGIADQKKPLREKDLYLRGFEKIKRATYLLYGIQIVKRGKEFYYTNSKGKEKQVKNIILLDKIFTDAGLPEPEIVDASGEFILSQDI